MPTTGPIYNLLADRYEGLLRLGLKFPRSTVLLAVLAVIPGWVLFNHVEPALCPRWMKGRW